LMLRIFIRQNGDVLAARLREAGFGITRVNACGSEGPAEVLLTVLRRKDCRYALNLVKQFAPQAFYTTEEVKSVSQSPFPLNERQPVTIPDKGLMFFRKQFAVR
jgi:uncharacterized protein YebE (UPF0316 family)